MPETAALFSYDHDVGSNLEFFADNKTRKTRIDPFEGVSLLFSMHGRHYTATILDNLDTRVQNRLNHFSHGDTKAQRKRHYHFGQSLRADRDPSSLRILFPM